MLKSTVRKLTVTCAMLLVVVCVVPLIWAAVAAVLTVALIVVGVAGVPLAVAAVIRWQYSAATAAADRKFVDWLSNRVSNLERHKSHNQAAASSPGSPASAFDVGPSNN